ncbi:2,3,4,5-tetrahydropyridine-2,6-dicarboxylate N-acetyltransferase [Streptobacillus moniliformis]|nr:2,3,4,5-tetrahydropyridine-2,6-dicarboxylate N-acetyltransferase [Streptobacillus moniliformis]
MTELERTKEIISFIANSNRKTPVKLYTDEDIKGEYDVKIIGKETKIIIGNWDEVEKLIKDNDLKIII